MANRTSNRRRGAILIVILVCFTVAAAMFVALARLSIAQGRATETQLWAAQARWIAEAAAERAAFRLAADANYVGETWAIPAAELGGKDGAEARIHVEKVAGQADRRLVRIEADYPNEPVHRARWAKQITVEIGKKP
jgi:type II secretory pathway component PulK